MNAEPAWVMLASYRYSYEAEFAAARLEEADIPALIQGLEVGLWGPGHAGPTITGPSVWVPDDRLEEARDLLAPGGEPADSHAGG